MPQPFPDASDFSPGIISSGGGSDLRGLLSVIAGADGDRASAVTAIRDRYFSSRALTQQLKSANNPLIALNPKNYGLLTSDLRPTETAVEIKEAPSEERALEVFARHILREMCGPDLLRAISSLQARGERPNKVTLAFELGLIGYSIGPTHTDATRMAEWLRQAGVLVDWRIDEDRVYELSGVTLSDMEEWALLDGPQRAFLQSLRRFAEIHGKNEIAIDAIREDVEALHGDSIWRRQDQIAAHVVYPLSEAAWLEPPIRAGRGARAGTTKATDRLLDVNIDVLDRQLLSGLPPEVRASLRMTAEELENALDGDRHTAGHALETLSARIALELGLTGITLRSRADFTGGSEVDLVAESVGWSYGRWVIQCKNTRSSIGVEVLTREVGVATIMHANTVVLVTRGSFSRDVERMANAVTRQTNLQVLLVDGPVLNRYLRTGVRSLTKDLRRQSQQTADARRDLT
jgi:hypothetical protein